MAQSRVFPGDVIILAAGIGSRLRPVTDSVPKCMVPVNGVSILARLLGQIQKAITDSSVRIQVVTGYKQAQVLECLKSQFPQIICVNNEDYLKTNNMFSLGLALPNVGDGDLVVINGDCVYDDEIVTSMIKTAGSLIAVDSSIFIDESMKVHIVDNVVRGISKIFDERPSHVVSIDFYRFSGVEKNIFMSTVSNILGAQRLTEWTEVAIHEMVQQSEVRMSVLDIAGKPWVEIDNFQDLRQAEELFA